MILSSTQKIFIVLALVFLLGFVAYGAISTGNTKVDTTSPVTTSSSVNGSDILALVEKFDKVSIDKTLFQSSLFMSLKDNSTPLTPESQGRPNPFAPIGFDNFSTASTPNPTSTSTQRTQATTTINR